MERVLKWNTEIKKKKKHFGLRILGKSRACYPHGYDPHQLYDAVLVPSLCMTAKMRDVVHKMSGMPIPHRHSGRCSDGASPSTHRVPLLQVFEKLSVSDAAVNHCPGDHRHPFVVTSECLRKGTQLSQN